MKKKFMTIYLREDEWLEIKRVMKEREVHLEKLKSVLLPKTMKKLFKQEYNLVYHFNHIAIDNIEDLARKEERRRKRDKSKQKKD